MEIDPTLSSRTPSPSTTGSSTSPKPPIEAAKIIKPSEKSPPALTEKKVDKSKTKEAPDPITLEKASKELEKNLAALTKLFEEEKIEEPTENETGFFDFSAFDHLLNFDHKFTDITGVLKDEAILVGGFLLDEYKPKTSKEISKLVSDIQDVLGVIENSSLLIHNKELIKKRKERLTYKETTLNNAKKELEETKETLTKEEVHSRKEAIHTLEKEIRVLKDSIQKVSYQINIETKKTILESGKILPSLVKNSYSALKFFGGVADLPLISQALELSDPALKIAKAAYELDQKTEEARSHERQIEDLNSLELKEISPNELKGVTEFNQISFLESIPQFLESIPQNELTTNQQAFKTLLNQRQAVKKERMGEELAWFNDLEALYKSKNDFTGFREKMAEEGIGLDAAIKTFDGLTDSVKDTLLDKHIEYKDTLTTIAKTQLKQRLQAHEKINHDFYTFKRNKSRVLFGITCITSLASLILASGLIQGLVVLPAAILSMPALIGTAVSVLTITIGLYYLHKKKPNLAKTYMRMVPLQIMANTIPILFSELGLKINEWRKEVLKEEIHKFATENFKKTEDIKETPKDEEPKKETPLYLKAESMIKDSVSFWTKTYSKYKAKVADLEEVVQARKDDYELNTRFKSFSGDDLNNLSSQLKGSEDKLEGLFKLYQEQRILELEQESGHLVLNQEGEFETRPLSEEEKKELQRLSTETNDLLKKIQFQADEIKILKGKIEKLQKKGADEFTILAEALIKGEFWKDPAAAALIKKYGGVELERELKLEGSTLEQNRAFLSQKLKSVILRNSKEMLKWLEKENSRS